MDLLKRYRTIEAFIGWNGIQLWNSAVHFSEYPCLRFWNILCTSLKLVQYYGALLMCHSGRKSQVLWQLRNICVWELVTEKHIFSCFVEITRLKGAVSSCFSGIMPYPRDVHKQHVFFFFSVQFVFSRLKLYFCVRALINIHPRAVIRHDIVSVSNGTSTSQISSIIVQFIKNSK